MVDNSLLKDYQVVKIPLEEGIGSIIKNNHTYPKYTTQIMNLANQNSQGTRPEVVGKMTSLIVECPDKSFSGWREWYQKQYPDAIDNATDKIFPMIKNLNHACGLIDRNMVREWVEELVIEKTALGLIIQEMILKYVANERKTSWKNATAEEESQNIDGFIGGRPVQIKPHTYLSQKPIVRENINIETIYYKQTPTYMYIYTKECNL
ncbi:hypothetical protein J2T58_001545 [Methanocalculus alkaliphilus]|uniref:MjaI family restriction endonuclease n=1 Tax=Methanocalculus alkaliphilus TaxID=768730 RepID=UPI00209DE6FF|nr:MjaI family restriction endonuclease [Methanocalculus alkaliphilus]MCP1715678.1 hypothetical protein [Methanocalculus alkaliphilus]